MSAEERIRAADRAIRARNDEIYENLKALYAGKEDALQVLSELANLANVGLIFAMHGHPRMAEAISKCIAHAVQALARIADKPVDRLTDDMLMLARNRRSEVDA